MKCCIAMTTSDAPKIKLVRDGNLEVTFEIYQVSADEMLKLCGKELKIEITEEK